MTTLPTYGEPLLSTGPRKLHAPATLRNRQPILDVLRSVVSDVGVVLEVGAGTGEHAVYFAAALPRVTWQPTDPDPDALSSIAAYAADAGLANLRPAYALDTRALPWAGVGEATVDAVVAINVIHISPWDVCRGLIAGAAGALKPDGRLVLYGPFKRDGRHTAASNARFDQQLRAMNPTYGVRDLGDVAGMAADWGLAIDREVAMPANNLTLVLRKMTVGRAPRTPAR